MGWELIALWAVSTLLAYATAPKPEEPSPSSLADFKVPTSDATRSMPVVFGTVWVTDPDVAWYGNLRVEPIEEDGGWFSSDVTVGWRYYLGMHTAIGYPVDELMQVRIGDRDAWVGSVSTGRIYIDKPGLFGDRDREGGVVGYVDVMMGEPTQAKNDYLVANLGTDIPAFRGALSLVWRQVYWGNSAYIKNPSFKLKRTDMLTDFNTQWYLAKANINNGDLNPAHIVLECLTNYDWGMGYPMSQNDLSTFTSVADTLFDEGFGLSLRWVNATSIEDFVKTILDHISGVLDTDPSTGLFTLSLIRNDYTPSSLLLLDQSNSQLVSFERRSWNDTINQVIVVYHDRETGLDIPTAPVQDPANIHMQGGGSPVSETVPLPGIPNAALADRVAKSILRAKSAPLSKIELSDVSRSAWQLRRGQVFRYSNAKLGLSEIVYRVAEITHGDLTDRSITLTAIEDVFALDSTTYIDQQPNGWVSPNTDPVDLAYQEVTQAGYWEISQRLTQAQISDLDPAFAMPLIYGADSAGDIYSYSIMVSSDGLDAYDESGRGRNSPLAQLSADVGKGVDTITLSSFLNIRNDMPGPRRYLLIGGEKMRLDSLDVVTGIAAVGRGVAGTSPEEHVAGDLVWFSSGGALDTFRPYYAGEDVDIKLLPKTSIGQLDLLSATLHDVNMVGAHNYPWPVANLHVDGNYYPADVTTWSFPVTWKTRNKYECYEDLVADTHALNVGVQPGTEIFLYVYNEAPALIHTETLDPATGSITFNNIPFSATELTFEFVTKLTPPEGGTYDIDRPESTASVTVNVNAPVFPPSYGDAPDLQFNYSMSYFEAALHGLPIPAAPNDYLVTASVQPGSVSWPDFTVTGSYEGYRLTGTDNLGGPHVILDHQVKFVGFATLYRIYTAPTYESWDSEITLGLPADYLQFEQDNGRYTAPIMPIGTVLVVNGEWMVTVSDIVWTAFDEITRQVYQLTVGVMRGVLDTVYSPSHAEGDAVYILPNFLSYSGHDPQFYASGTTVNRYVLPYDDTAVTTVDQATELTTVVPNRITKPLPPARLSIDLVDPTTKYISCFDSCDVSYMYRSRTDVADVHGYFEDYDPAAEAGVSYVVEIWRVTGGVDVLMSTITTTSKQVARNLSAAPISNTKGLYRLRVTSIIGGIESGQVAELYIVIGIAPNLSITHYDSNTGLFSAFEYNKHFDTDVAPVRVFKETAVGSRIFKVYTPPTKRFFFDKASSMWFVNGKWRGIGQSIDKLSYTSYYLLNSVSNDSTDIETAIAISDQPFYPLGSKKFFYANSLFFCIGNKLINPIDSDTFPEIYVSSDFITWSLFSSFSSTLTNFKVVNMIYTPLMAEPYLLIGTEDDGFNPTEANAFSTTDGTSFTPVTAITTHVTCHPISSFSFAGQSSNTIVISGTSCATPGPDLIVSLDGGVTWLDRSANVPGSGEIFFSGANLVLFTSKFQSHYSVDLGITWVTTPKFDYYYSANDMFTEPNIIDSAGNILHSNLFPHFYPEDSQLWWFKDIFNHVGVYETVDNGVTWVAENNYLGIDYSDPLDTQIITTAGDVFIDGLPTVLTYYQVDHGFSGAITATYLDIDVGIYLRPKKIQIWVSSSGAFGGEEADGGVVDNLKVRAEGTQQVNMIRKVQVPVPHNGRYFRIQILEAYCAVTGEACIPATSLVVINKLVFFTGP